MTHMGMGMRATYPVATVVVAQDGTGDYNGTTGETIQAAIDSLGTNGGWVYIKNGTYWINTGITISNPSITVSGAGESTVLYSNCTGKVFYITSSNITLKDFIIQQPPPGEGGFLEDYYIYSTGQGTVVDSVEMTFMNHTGVYFSGVQARLRNCNMTFSSGTGATDSFVESRGSYAVFMNNFLYFVSILATNTIAFNIQGGNSSLLIGNQAISCSKGIYIAASSSNNRVIGNLIAANGVIGIDVNSGNNIITGNSVWDNANTGIKITNATQNIISGNSIYKGAGSQAYGIVEAGTSDYNMVNGNICKANSLANYTIIGANTVVGANADWT